MGNANGVFQVGGAHVLSIACLACKFRRRLIVQTAVWPLLVVVMAQIAIFLLVSNKFWNQLIRKHSSRSRPWKLSTCAFCVGFPGWICTSSIFFSMHQARKCRLVSSGPLSQRIAHLVVIRLEVTEQNPAVNVTSTSCLLGMRLNVALTGVSAST